MPTTPLPNSIKVEAELYFSEGRLVRITLASGEQEAGRILSEMGLGRIPGLSHNNENKIVPYTITEGRCGRKVVTGLSVNANSLNPLARAVHDTKRR